MNSVESELKSKVYAFFGDLDNHPLKTLKTIEGELIPFANIFKKTIVYWITDFVKELIARGLVSESLQEISVKEEIFRLDLLNKSEPNCTGLELNLAHYEVVFNPLGEEDSVVELQSRSFGLKEFLPNIENVIYSVSFTPTDDPNIYQLRFVLCLQSVKELTDKIDDYFKK